MQEKWNLFVHSLLEDKKTGVEEAIYHKTIERQFQHLKWLPYQDEICHKLNIPIGNNGYIQPDILITRDGKKQFVIEVKHPQHIQIAKDRDQLVSYMRQLKLEVGIYIGEHIEIFYDKPKSENAISVLTIPLEYDNKRGVRFVELFSKERFSQETIIQFCEERIKEMRHQESLNKIKENLLNQAQQQITESMKMYLMEKYGNTFTENDIANMLGTIEFTATLKGSLQQNTAIIPQTIFQNNRQIPPKPESSRDKTKYSINGSEFIGKGRFVLQLVKIYVEQHPNLTFLELEQIFTPRLQGSLGVIRPTAHIREKEYNRYYVKANELLHSADGIDFAVCSQWGISNIPKVVERAKELGYEIKTQPPTF
ncbi:MAG: hypothetical protein K2M96_10855 [Prevotella sp.]|nr:hypothetical protein [Prevotella sp.]